MSHSIVLASTSKYRKALLEKIGITFSCESPDIDETPTTDETPEVLVKRLAFEKAKVIADKTCNSWVIGCDQVCSIDEKIVGKPGTVERAKHQLAQASGKTITFYTGLCLFDSIDQSYQVICDKFNVHFRDLTTKQIERYVEIEQPIDCAGSFKSEGLGIVLFEKLEGRDPNTLIGLPLIALVEMFKNKGLTLPM